VAVLADKRVIAIGTIDELLSTDHPWIQEYFRGPRGRAAVASADARPVAHPARAEAQAAAHPTEVRAEQDSQAGISSAQMRAH
jgi:phospholipid/cholesterol/gamma-HCH transport system ATP-binding protein